MSDYESVSGFEQAMRFQDDAAAGDRHLAVRFYTEEVEDVAASQREGRPIYKTVECCEIRVPGDKYSIVRGRLKHLHPDPRERFPAAYARFKAGEKAQVVGTPLVQWGVIPRTRALEYERLGVITVEQLAGLADGNALAIPGAITEKQKAKDFLEMTKGQAPLAQARAENEKLRSEMQAMKDAIEDLKASLAKDEDEAPKRRGRPPKIPEA